MKTYRFTATTEYLGPEFTEVVEIEDTVPDAELKAIYEDWVLWSAVKGGYTEVEQ